MMLGTACDAEEAIARLKSEGIARYLKKGLRREFGDDFGKSGARVSGKKGKAARASSAAEGRDRTAIRSL